MFIVTINMQQQQNTAQMLSYYIYIYVYCICVYTHSFFFIFYFFSKINNVSDVPTRPESALYSRVDISEWRCASLKWACARLLGPRTFVSSSFLLIPVAIFPSVRLNAFGGGLGGLGRVKVNLQQHLFSISQEVLRNAVK